MTREELIEMADTNIKEVDPDHLVDINYVVIRKDLPKEERIRDYIEQVKNPYCYKSQGVIVKIGFAGKTTLNECLEKCFTVQ